MPSTIEAIYFHIFYSFLENFCRKCQKIAYIKNCSQIELNLTTKIVMLVNIEPILEFMFDNKSFTNYQQGHTVSLMCFNMEHVLE